MQELVIANELRGLPESKAKQIKEVFEPMVKMLEGFEGQFAEVMHLEQSKEKSAKAKRLRIDISRVRSQADKIRIEQKEEYLRAGKAIQGVYNILEYAVKDREIKLRDVEEFYIRIEAEEKKALQADRVNLLAKYEVDGSRMDLASMPGDVWNNFFTGSKVNWEAAKEAERKAEQDRIEDEKKRVEEEVRIRAENEALRKSQAEGVEKARIAEEARKAELAKIEAQRKAGLAKIESQRKAELDKIEGQRKAEAEKHEAERRAQEEKIRAEREVILAKEREIERQKAEEARAKAESEAKAQAEAKKAELAPDKEKLLALAAELLKKVDSVKSDKAKEAIKKAYSILSQSAVDL